MDFDYVVWIGAALFVLLVWIFVASEWGFVHSVDERGFTFRNLLGRRRILRWDTLSESAQQFTTFLPSPTSRVNCNADQVSICVRRPAPPATCTSSFVVQ